MAKLIFTILILLEISLSLPFCLEGENNCSKCNPITKLCVKCDKDVYSPDEKGGCENSKKCITGNNYCNECSENENICKLCEEGFFPDDNGGCSYTNNCEVSYKGQCLKCKEDFILIGKENISSKEITICKSLKLDDFKNCLKINTEIGICEECEEGFYLNHGDKKCSKVENCNESAYGICKICKDGFYLDKNENKCNDQVDNFLNCKLSIDGNKCDECIDEYFLNEELKCVNTNYCKVANKDKCEECIDGYFLSKSDKICTMDKNCDYGDNELGICLSCIENYAIDFKDGKCKENTEDNKYKFCLEIDEDNCIKCIKEYYLGEDKKCSKIKNCAESDSQGNCLVCSEKYYLDLDNYCIDVEHCIHSYYGECIECEEDYYYDKFRKKCILAENQFKNCQYGVDDYCLKCRDNFYFNQKDSLCHNNEENEKFYKCQYSDYLGENCLFCENGYHLGNLDKKCNNIEGCDKSENKDKCLICSYSYCLNAKTGKCINNRIFYNEEDKIFYRCNKTNEEGTACEICNDGYFLNEEGLCYDYTHCIEEENGACQKCEPKEGEEGFYCLNNEFGCVNTLFDNCLKCDNILDFDQCNQCLDNYILNEYDKCV